MNTLNDKIKQYVQLRDYLDEAKKEFNTSMDRVKKAMSKLESEFATHLNDTGSNSANTDAGTIYKIERSSATVQDRDEFFKFAIKGRHLEAMDIRANKKIVRELLDQGVEVPGVKFTQSTQIGIRRGKES